MTTTGSAGADQPGSASAARATPARSRTAPSQHPRGRRGPGSAPAASRQQGAGIRPVPRAGPGHGQTSRPAAAAASPRYSASRVFPTPASPTTTSPAPLPLRSRRIASAMRDTGPSRPTRIGQRTPHPTFPLRARRHGARLTGRITRLMLPGRVPPFPRRPPAGPRTWHPQETVVLAQMGLLPRGEWAWTATRRQRNRSIPDRGHAAGGSRPQRPRRGSSARRHAFRPATCPFPRPVVSGKPARGNPDGRSPHTAGQTNPGRRPMGHHRARHHHYRA